MESLSKQELISTITKQADQIKRYEARLRDVVTAYKGLTKEKEALENSLKVINSKPSLDEPEGDDSVSALTLSLATLTSEKSRMEEAFQSDKKLTREKYDYQIASLKDENKLLVQQHLLEVNSLQAKINSEMQEKERDRADHRTRIKELQSKLQQDWKSNGVEANLKDRGSGQLGASAARAEASVPALQQQLATLQRAHSLAVRQEQAKAVRAEEAARRAAARAEERAWQLEEKVTQLSLQLAELAAAGGKAAASDERRGATDAEKLADGELLRVRLDKLQLDRRELQALNERLGRPVDLAQLFPEAGDAHAPCRRAQLRLQEELRALEASGARAEAARQAEADALREDAARLREQGAELQRALEAARRQREAEGAEARELAEEASCSQGALERLQREAAELRARVAELQALAETHRRRHSALLAEQGERGERGERAEAALRTLHGATEEARGELQLQQLRKDCLRLERLHRECQREATIEKERFKEVVRTLKEEIDRLARGVGRSGASLEYLKNVVLAFAGAADAQRRRHMLNAIAAVLRFSPAERRQAFAALP